ncbi:MAG: aminopeptidase P N-terminal domain-containing protein [Acidobacteria bacterium]|nr:aminopeptidase P N-terminal domain-containing protein [Acidobacteriota bacterium]
MKASRLDQFMMKMNPASVAIFAGSHDIRRNADTDFEFRQEADFFYLTRLNEPDCVAIIAPQHPQHKYILFVRPRIREEEIWTGIRTGVEGAIRDYGADAAYDIGLLDQVLPKYLENVDQLYYRFGNNEQFDRKVISAIKFIREKARGGLRAPTTIIDPGTIVHEMRLRKDADDLKSLQRAIQISAEGHLAAMKHCRPGMYEYELEAVIEFVFRKNGASGVGYPSIVGSGFNSTILHYNTNNDRIDEGDLVLVDAGAEYNLFSGDITRTFPANGKFSKSQQAIYEAVLTTNQEVIKMVKPGESFMKLHEKAVEVISDQLRGLGLVSGSRDEIIEEGSYKKFFMHRTGHWLGMDVHDVGRYRVENDWRKLEPGMVFTVEPGIYIPAGAEGVDEEYFNIGVRIEDDVLVTENGYEVLTTMAPKLVGEVEAVMRETVMIAV